jgi:hypothetical protein
MKNRNTAEKGEKRKHGRILESCGGGTLVSFYPILVGVAREHIDILYM